MDLDDFKDVNNLLGHAAGDQLLVQVAERLSACLRETDTACRWGGDEFVILCDQLDDPVQANHLAARIAAIYAVPFSLGGTQLCVTGSLGIAVDDGSALSEELLLNADVAMYQSKDKGKDRYEIYDRAMRAAVLRKSVLASELETALVCGQLRLHYQPLFSMTSGLLVGVEALLRWQHPVRGLLTPAHFLDIAESHQLMVPIGTGSSRPR